MNIVKHVRRRLNRAAAPCPHRAASDPLDVFIHVPKTGGSTVRTVLTQNYREDQMRAFDGSEADFRAFLAGDGTFTGRTRILHGHVPLGVERGTEVPLVRRVTMLREPISRLVSDYLFSMSPESGYHEKVICADMSFLEFAGEGTGGLLRNAQSKWISGIHPLEGAELDDGQLFDRAVAALDQYQVVGINEMLPETLLLFARALKWRPPVYQSVNVSPLSKSYLAYMPSDVALKVADLNRVDIELYRLVQERFRNLTHSLGPSFWAAVEEVRLAASRNDVERGATARKGTFVIGRDAFQASVPRMPRAEAFIDGNVPNRGAENAQSDTDGQPRPTRGQCGQSALDLT